MTRFSTAGLTVLKTLLFASVVLNPGAGRAQQTPAASECSSPSPGSYRPELVEPGDRLKITVYEILDTQDDKWGSDRQKQQTQPRGLFARGELSGEYVVQQDGSVAVPTLGSFVIQGQKPGSAAKLLASAFEASFGRKGFVSIVSHTKRPVYITGAVKASGSFAYTPGMTVLHAVAMSGGLDRGALEQWQVAEVVRESERMQQAIERASRYLARAIAIEAERNERVASTPDELADLVGSTKATSLVQDEATVRKLSRMSITAEENALQAAVTSAENELKLRQSQFEPLQSTIALRRERVANLTELADKGSLGRPVVIQAQTELADVQQRQHETQMTINAARDRLDRAKQDLERHRIQSLIGVRRDLLGSRNDTVQALGDAQSAANVSVALARPRTGSAVREVAFLIVRSNGTQQDVFIAGETASVLPGDVIEVIDKSETATRTVSRPPCQQPSTGGNN